MCGIAGFTGEWSQTTLDSFERALGHRGPDDSGSLITSRISLFNSRLAIIDLPGGHQPLFNDDRSVVIVFNGEIYNHRELRDRFCSDYRFNSESDTEVILRLYEEVGTEVVSLLRGDFAFCIWDGRDGSCFLSRDPLGVKPLYWAESSGGNIAFSSELSALLLHPGTPRKADPVAVIEFFRKLYVPAPATLVSGVRKLEPGESLLWKAGRVRTWKHWEIPPVSAVPSREDFVTDIRQKLVTAVQRRLVSDVPVGALLSGGIDSSLLVALARQEGVRLHTFTVGFGDPDFDELAAARQLAGHFDTEHHEFVIRPDIESLLEEVITAMDEPIADSSAIPTFVISRETSRFVKVVLSGVGGDEMFFGYPRYAGFRLSERLPRLFRGGVAALARRFKSHPDGRDIGGRIRRFGAGLELGPSERYAAWTTHLPESVRGRFLNLSSPGAAISSLERMGSGSSDLLDEVFRLDVEGYLSSNLLKFADGMTMAHSLEVRVPFCDVDLVEAIARTPASLRFPGFRLKGVLKEIGRDYLPDFVLRRKKQGFMIPIGRWFKGELQSYIRAQLAPARLPPFFDAEGVGRMIDEHVSGEQNHTHLLWASLVMVRWLRAHPEVDLGDLRPGTGMWEK